MIFITFMAWLKKAWAWFKKNWKWVLFPIGLIGLLIAVCSVKKPTVTPPVTDPLKTAEELAALAAERDKKLIELKEQHAARLEQLSEDQKKELEGLQARPIEDVVKWFDSL